MRFFITATDTGAGKTFVTCLLLRALRAAGLTAVGFKPVCCGSRQDVADLLDAGSPGPSAGEVNPVHYRMPLAPLAAGMLENRPFPFGDVRAAWRDLSARYEHILVEGAGGWEVPLTAEKSVADLAVELALPVIVVVHNKLGALNHTILTVRSIRQRGLTCAGLILNHVEDERDTASISNAAVLRAVLPDVPVLAEVMHGETELRLEDLPLLSGPAETQRIQNYRQ
jgi:dethiobiotin synthetase